MKSLKTILGIALSIGGFGTAATVAGVSMSAQSNEVIQAEAVYSKIYYVGTENSWRNPDQDMTGYQFEYEGSKTINSVTSHYYSLTLDIAKDSIFKLRDWEDGHNVDWMNSYDGTKVLQGLVDDGSNDHNLKCLMTGNYKITYRYTNSSDRCIEGFELQNATQMYYVANNTTWAASGKIYLHAWTGSGDLTNWNGSCLVNKVSAVKVTSSKYDFYAFKIPNTATGFQIKHYDGNTDYKTDNFTRSAGACFTSTGSADLGSAGAIVASIYSKMGEATYLGNTYEQSICAISASDKTTIVSNYNGLSASAKTMFDNSTLNTYNPNNLSQKTDVSYSTIINTLKSSTPSGANVIRTVASNNAVIVVVVISVIGISAVGAFFLLRKKKEI